jgi:hypothetical protein
LLEQFGQTLERVLYIETACALHDISSDSYRRWVARGEAELARVAADGRRRVRAEEQPFVDFCGICARARARAEERLLSTIEYHATMDAGGDWKAAAWKLERAFPYKWGKRERIEHSGKVDSDVTFRVVVPTPSSLGDDEPDHS